MNRISPFLLLLCLTAFSSCDLIGGIFKAGMWSGVIVVVAIIALVIWFIARAGRGNRGA